MDEDIVVPIAFFITIIVIAIVVPLVRATVRQWDRKPQQAGLTPELEARLDRLEAMVETIAVEVERMAEGQRFTTRLLSEGAARPVMEQTRSATPAQASNTEVTHA